MGALIVSCGKAPDSSGSSGSKGKDKSEPTAPPPSVVDTPPSTGEGGAEADGEPADPGAPATLSGTAVYVGDPPARQELPVANTDGCDTHETPPLNERVVVSDGKLANVFVYVSKGLSNWEGEPPSQEPLVIHQTGCIYQPHMNGVRAGRPVHVENRDPITHNVHVKSLKNGEPNQAQAASSDAIVLNLTEPEVPVTMVCDLHPWMKAYVCVVDHPFFAVTGEDGSFSIEGLPAGKYTLTAWHESLGRQKVELEVGPGGGKQVQFSYPK